VFKSVRYLLVVALLLAVLTGSTIASAAGGWTVTQLTEDSIPGWKDYVSAEVSGDRVVWCATDGEIYTWTAGDALPTKISADGVGGVQPQVSGDRAVWCTDAGEIYTWTVGDAAPTNISTSGGTDNSAPQVSGDRVVWSGWDGDDYEIYTWTVGDAAAANVSNSDDTDDYDPQVSGDRIVWSGWYMSVASDIYTWTAADAVPVKISTTGGFNDQPQVSGDRVVWSGSGEGSGDIYTWVAGDAGPVNISNSEAVFDYDPQVSGDRVVWGTWDDSEHALYTWAAGDAVPVKIGTTGEPHDQPQVSGDRVVWSDSDGSGGDIYTWAAGDAAPVNISATDGIVDYKPQISGDRVVWHGWNRSSDYHNVYTATPEGGVEPPSFDLEHDAAGVVFDRFVTGYLDTYSGGGYVYGRWAGTVLKATFTGPGIRWVGPMQPDYGMADVWIDGALVASDVDCYAPEADKTLSAVIWESAPLADGAHTIEIRLMGRKNALSSDYIVVLDKFEVLGSVPVGLGTRIDDSTATPGYTGTWMVRINPTYFNKTYSYSRWTNAAFTVSFTGTRVSWIGPRTPNYGIADVFIDDVKVATVDCYRANLALQGWREVVWQSDVLTPGAHTLVIRPTGAMNPAATAANVVVDAIDVTP